MAFSWLINGGTNWDDSPSGVSVDIVVFQGSHSIMATPHVEVEKSMYLGTVVRSVGYLLRLEGNSYCVK